MNLPSHVKVVEVGPRDGLQNEKRAVSLEAKIAFIETLAEAGLPVVEAGAFVSPKWVPQMADSDAIFQRIKRLPNTRYPALVPNLKGLERALTVGVTDIALFTAASETFCQRNMNMTIEESLQGFQSILPTARQAHCWVRVYVSTAFVCPYEGKVSPDAVMRVVSRILEWGVDEISIGDTIGAAVPTDVEPLTLRLLDAMPANQLAYHFHDTRGTALANTLCALQMGVSIFDSSAGGLGGCPFAPGAAGNLATESLLYMLHGMGIETGVDVSKVAEASRQLQSQM